MPQRDCGPPWGKVEIPEGYIVLKPVQVSCLRCGEMHPGWRQRLEQIGCVILTESTLVGQRIRGVAVRVNSVLVGLPRSKLRVISKNQKRLSAVSWVQEYSSVQEARQVAKQLGVEHLLREHALILMAVGRTEHKALERLLKYAREFFTHLAIGGYHVEMPFDFSEN